MAKKDDDVDAVRSQVFRELTYMTSDPKTVLRALELLAAQHLERAADHVTNIGERVVYMVTGELLELNVQPARGRLSRSACRCGRGQEPA